MATHPVIDATRAVDSEASRETHERRACAINAVLTAMDHVGRRRLTDSDAQTVWIIEQLLGTVVDSEKARKLAAGFGPSETKSTGEMGLNAVQAAVLPFSTASGS